MEVALAILLFVCMTALLYVLLSLKITRQVDLQMKEFYKTRIHSDIQEFYREMEGYAVLMENRIQRFKSLVERSEQVSGRSAEVNVTEHSELPLTGQTASVERSLKKKKAVQKSAAIAVPEKKKASERNEKKAAKIALVEQAKGKGVRRQVERASPAVAAAERIQPAKPQPIPVAPVATPDYDEQVLANGIAEGIDTDTTIAEELMKDLFAQDEVQLSHGVNPAAASEPKPSAAPKPVKPTASVEAEASGVPGILARIGKALEPVVFGEWPQANTATAKPAAKPVSEPTISQYPAASAKTTDFAEVLRRAEQIKAEKQAERERAEVEARAEFYARGDAFALSNRTRGVSANTESSTLSGSNAGGAKPATRRGSDVAPGETRARNSLAVKSLDEHTINFLIDSLKHDSGYRKQALRALTENNIPLEEIARLSRIDIGELQLMNQLGKF